MTGSAHILVAEDEDSVRAFVIRALSEAGYTVTGVRNGQLALERLMNGSTYDLLLSDIVMPELDGIALALKVGKEFPDLPILLMSGYAEERQRAHNLEVLSQDVLAKPFTLRDLLDRVAAALAPKG